MANKNKSTDKNKITDPEEKRIIGLKVKAIEELMGVTGKELARICGVSDTTIYRIEGRTKSDAAISVRTIKLICEKSGADIDWLMSSDSEVEPVGMPTMSVMPENSNPSEPSVKSASSVQSELSEPSEPSVAFVTSVSAPSVSAPCTSATPATPAERIKAVRNELRMSQVEFAKHTGLSSGNLAGIETGRTRVTNQTAKKIENVCEHGGAEWILTGDERNKDYPVNDRMIEWLKEHRKLRKKIYRMMEDEEEGDEVDA